MWYRAALFLILAGIEVVVGAADDALEVLSCGDIILDVVRVESVPVVSIGQRLHIFSLGDQYTSTYRRL